MKHLGSRALAEATGSHPGHIAADRPTFSLTLTLPTERELVAGPPADEMLDRLERSNGTVVATLLKCADLGKPPVEDEALTDALEPLRVKIDMMLEMVARLSYRATTLPDPHPIELGLVHIRWSQREPLAIDRWLLSKIYFHETYREPVILAGRVASCSPAQSNGIHNIELDLAEMSDSLGESFARLVFLEHRRQLAFRAGHRNALVRGQ